MKIYCGTAKQISSVIMLMLLIVCCNNPFATREPEPPTEERSNWVQPTSPLAVISNLKNAIQDGNTPNYMLCLTDSTSRFRFIPDALVNQTNVGAFEGWNLYNERYYVTQLFSASVDSLRKVTFSNIDYDYQDSVLVRLNYELELHHSWSDNPPKYAEGQANFWLHASDGEWFITRWEDYSTAEDRPSWSLIKASFGK